MTDRDLKNAQARRRRKVRQAEAEIARLEQEGFASRADLTRARDHLMPQKQTVPSKPKAKVWAWPRPA